jgi:hypothetical protein
MNKMEENEINKLGEEKAQEEKGIDAQKEVYTPFDIKTESKLLSKMGGLLTLALEPDMDIKGDFGVMDPANVAMVCTKTPEARVFLKRFKEKESNQTVPELNYKSEAGIVSTSKYSMEYLKKIIDILGVFRDFNTAKISVQRNYPITIENKHFKIILAPKVTEEEDYE